MIDFIIGLVTVVLLGGTVWALGYGAAYVLDKATKKFRDEEDDDE